MMTLSRRIILQGLLASVATGALAQQPPNGVPAPNPFRFEDVVRRARELAGAPYDAMPSQLPEPLNTLSFDDYRDIRFRPERALLGSGGSQYRMQLFHLGFLYQRPVTVNVLRDGVPTPVPYQRELFNYGRNKIERPLPVNLGFAGFRLHYPINTPKVFDEVIAFLGASYFRFLGSDQKYGLSARGLAINVEGGEAEEFPYFREFWIQMPTADTDRVTIFALLDSPVRRGRLPLRSLSFAGNHSRGHRHAVPPPDHCQSRPRTPDLHVLPGRERPEEHRRFQAGTARFGRPADAIRAPASGSGGLCAIRPRRPSRRSATTIPAASD